jgi:hypothetical protein
VKFPVVVINDLNADCSTSVCVRLTRNNQAVQESTQACQVPALGKQTLAFAIPLPQQPGRYQLEATLTRAGAEPVRSLRDFAIAAKTGRSPGQPAPAQPAK